MRKIAYISGTRADYGLMQSTLREINNNPELKLSLVVTGMHLSKKFGYTANDIKKDGFKIADGFRALNTDDSGESMAFAFGKQVAGFTKAFKKIKPDIILLEADRGEMLAAAIAGRYLNIAIAHVSGGDTTSGATIDESIRHAITKFAHIHFPGTSKSSANLIKTGEEPWRVHMVGDPGVDSILKQDAASASSILKKFNINAGKPVLLVCQHPVHMEIADSANQIKETMEALVKLKHQSIVIYPNADAGAKAMIKTIEKYKKYPFIRIYRHLPHKEFIGLMKMASVMAGNSSSGIVEAPLLSLPVINIGTRQSGRERAKNIIDVGYDRRKIEKAIQKALNTKRRKMKIRSPYVGINTGKKIADILCKIKIDKKLLEKRLIY